MVVRESVRNAQRDPALLEVVYSSAMVELNNAVAQRTGLG
jgi:hypothetical protein